MLLHNAARFLDLDRQELRAQLPGTSLAALAEKQGKSVASLEAAMVAPAKARLAKAVANEKLTQARADAVLDKLESAADRLAEARVPEEVALTPGSRTMKARSRGPSSGGQSIGGSYCTLDPIARA